VTEERDVNGEEDGSSGFQDSTRRRRKNKKMREERQESMEKNEAIEKEQRREEVKEVTTLNSNKFYESLNNGYILSRLEEPQLLSATLRIIVRNIHPNWKTITLPVIEEVDRINLRSNAITTEPKELLELVDKVFTRRNETLQLNEVYRQFVMACGRTVFIPTEKFPACYVHTRQS